jgi:hypothetical protein
VKDYVWFWCVNTTFGSVLKLKYPAELSALLSEVFLYNKPKAALHLEHLLMGHLEEVK